jgi:endonuclease YncB( thermonuclease family)
MSYRIVYGEFDLVYKSTRRVGSRPDGDSMWFKPLDEIHLTKLGDRKVEYNKGGFVQLRFEGIDALELHFNGSHQNISLAIDARDFLLQKVGFTEVEYAGSLDPKLTVKSSIPDTISGYILTKDVDPYGRPISFVFVGSAEYPNGEEVWLTPIELLKSLNAQLMEQGVVYPAYYSGLPSDLRDKLTLLFQKAKNSDLNIWNSDTSLDGFNAVSRKDLESMTIWPKFYRRLAKFFGKQNKSLGGFDSWLRSDKKRDDRVFIFPICHLGNLHDIFKLSNNKISMTYLPHQFMIVPR